MFEHTKLDARNTKSPTEIFFKYYQAVRGLNHAPKYSINDVNISLRGGIGTELFTSPASESSGQEELARTASGWTSGNPHVGYYKCVVIQCRKMGSSDQLVYLDKLTEGQSKNLFSSSGIN